MIHCHLALFDGYLRRVDVPYRVIDDQCSRIYFNLRAQVALPVFIHLLDKPGRRHQVRLESPRLVVRPLDVRVDFVIFRIERNVHIIAQSFGIVLCRLE